jgi:pimeloyl-ACP methyl ester carboxylesterase
MANHDTPVMFVHGLWLHASSWTPWIEKLQNAGFSTSAPGWPGEPDTVEAARANPEAVAGIGVDAVVEHYAKAAADLGTAPIAIGHSFGGLIVQRLLAEGVAAAAISLDAAPIKGVILLPPSALKVASVALRNPANRKRSVSLTPEQFRYGFGNAVSAEESRRLYDAWTIPSPGRPLFEAAVANFSPHSPAKVDVTKADRGPLLLVAGSQDKTAPVAVQRTMRKLHAKSSAVTDYREFDRGHSIPVDSGWSEVADASLDWLATKGF